MTGIRSEALQNTLLLGAVGDALGAPVEFMGARIIERTYGLEPPADLAFASPPPAKFTDDTQMTLFMAEGLRRALDCGVARDRKAFRQEMARSLVHWLGTQNRQVFEELDDRDSRLLEVEGLRVPRAPGNTCLTSCRHIYDSGPRRDHLPDIDRRINDSKGCGAVMRSAPFGLVAESAEEAFGWARDAGVLTHCHSSGYLSAAYFAAVIFGLARGQGFDEAMAVADELLTGEEQAEETQEAVAGARRAASGGELNVDELVGCDELISFDAMVGLGQGWVGEEALAIALAVAMGADVASEEGIRQALWLSVRHSGDSDSTGAMVGNLIGAMCAPEAMPERWLAQIEMRQVVAHCLS
jgi:ADP-ribosylglycohydrolase